jgi:para-aminobenzoate synthetase component 1
MPHGIIERRWCTASGAVVAELRPDVSPRWLFERLAGRAGLLFLDSCSDAQGDAGQGPAGGFAAGLARYSFVAADPVDVLAVDGGGVRDGAAKAIAELRSRLAAVEAVTIPGLPPFQGGYAGLLGYEFGLALLGLASPAGEAAAVPAVVLNAYDVVAAFDHESRSGWIISQGLAASGGLPRGPVARRGRAEARLASFLAMVEEGPRPIAAAAGRPSGGGHPLPAHPAIRSSHSRADHEAMVRRAIEYVRAGDIFQVNLAQRLSTASPCDPVSLHLAARRINAAPFSTFFDLGEGRAIVSSSPERFLQVTRGVVRMHPIKGTRRMTRRPEADLFAGDDLGGSVKDRAENVMIVDLVRNDLSRVCTAESVRVEALCRLERYAYVQHLVSVVAGRLAKGRTALDAILAAAPAGSVTGAPKHRGCEIISELEGIPRGPYCGSIGYIGFDGTADWNLLIRTFVASGGGLTFSVGGGITAASDPAAEYDETLHKAEGLIRVLDAVAAGPRSTEAVGVAT